MPINKTNLYDQIAYIDNCAIIDTGKKLLNDFDELYGQLMTLNEAEIQITIG